MKELPFQVGEKWISALVSKLISIKKRKNIELDYINDIILFNNPVTLAKVYVEPFCQEINPADRHDEDFFVAKEPMFKKMNDFFKMNAFQQGNNQLFLLSDAGMGKTSFLVMLKLLHLSSFWLKEYDCVLRKLNESTLEEISAIENKRKTVLLLDSLDEDPVAYGRVRERLGELLESTKYFHKVVITCRTQFFPHFEKDPLELPGRIKLNNFICPSKYISLFTDEQVDAYLSKRFPTTFLSNKNLAKVSQAKDIVAQMGSLRCRPMLLSFIEDLIDSPIILPINSEYQIYYALVQNWLAREQSKTNLDSKQLFRACAELSFKMQAQRKVKISSTELEKEIAVNQILTNIKLIEITGRSLLNRNSSGDYRFSHYSIQEFLVVYYIVNYCSPEDEGSIYPTDFIKKLLEQNLYRIKVRLEALKDDDHNIGQNIETYISPSNAANDQRFHNEKEIGEILKEALNLFDEDIHPFQDELDVPTFLRKHVGEYDRQHLRSLVGGE